MIAKRISTSVTSLAAAASAISLSLVAAPSVGQQVLEEVIVTATRRSESLQDVPVAVTAFNTAQLEQNVMLELSDIQEQTPSLFITQSQGASTSVIVELRGQVQNDSSVTTLDPSVGIYFNGVYIGRAQGAMMEMFDIASVEILKGSQGTLYGRNTTGGAIKVETVKPEPGEPVTGYAGGAVGNFDSYRYEGAVSFPLGDTAALRIAGRHNENEGWAKALAIDPLTGETTDSNLTNGRDSDLLRASLVWDATDILRVTFNGEYYSNDDAGALVKDQLLDRWTAPLNFEATPDWLEAGSNAGGAEGSVKNETYDLTFDLAFEAFDMKAILAHRKWDFDNRFDTDGTSFNLIDTIFDADGEQDSLEVQFSGLAFNDKLNWLAGIYYFEEEALDNTLTSFGGAPIIYDGDVSGDSTAVFTHLIYSLTDKLSLTGGIRYTEDTKELDGANRQFGSCVYNPDSPDVTPDGCFGSFSDDWSFVSWTVGLDYVFSDSVMAYVKANKGQRSGGQQLRGTGPAFSELQQAVVDTTLPFDEEEVLDYEVGIKSEFLDGLARLNAAYYYVDYQDFQYSEVIAVSTYVQNLGDADVQGVELEGTLLFGEGFSLNGFFSWLDLEYDERFQSGSPEFKWGLSLSYSTEVDYGEWNATVGYSWTDERGSLDSQFDELNEFLPLEDYSLVNGRIELALNSGLSLAAYGKNLTDEEYSLGALGTFVGNLLLGDPYISNVLTPAEPRTYGLELRYAF